MHPTGYFIPKVEISNYSVTIVGRNFFDEPINNDRIKYDIVWKITTIPGAVCSIIFISKHQVTAIDLSKQQSLDSDLKAIHWLISLEI